MSGLGFLDRLQTIVATATVTSAIWILVGTGVVGLPAGESREATKVVRSAPVASPAASPPAASGDQLTIPVVGVKPGELTDSFAEARGGRRHEAIDILALAGTPIVAAAPGTVEKLFRSEAGGNTVYVRSADRRTIYYYAHLRDYAQGLAEGQTVRRGQPLGTVGSTGNADPAAPHLHFAVLQTTQTATWWDSATAIDPYPLLLRQ